MMARVQTQEEGVLLQDSLPGAEEVQGDGAGARADPKVQPRRRPRPDAPRLRAMRVK